MSTPKPVSRAATNVYYDGPSTHTYYDASGNPVLVVGAQEDGTFAVIAQNGSAPPAATDPTLVSGQMALTVHWSGGLVSTAPADFSHVEVHMSQSSGFTPTSSTLQGIMQTGGNYPLAPLVAGDSYFVRLVSVNTSGISGPASGQAVGVPTGVSAGDIVDATITTAKLADAAVTSTKIADGAVGGDQIATSSIDPTKVAFTAHDINGVQTSLLSSSPSSPNIGDLWMDSSNGNQLYRWDGSSWVSVQDTAIAAAQSAADSKVKTFIQSTTPTASGVGDLWYDSANDNRLKRWDGSSWITVQLGTGAISSNAITAGLLASGAVDATALAAGAVTETAISAGAVGTNELAANAVTAGKIAAATITATQIAAGTITTSQIAAAAITASLLAADAVDASKIAAGAIIAGKIAAGAVGASEIAADSIQAGHIQSAAITADKLESSLVLASQIVAQTSSSSSQVVMDSTGLNAYDDQGNNTVTIGADGSASFTGTEVTAGTINADTFTVSSSTGGLFIYGATGSAINANPDFATNITNWTLAQGTGSGASLTYSSGATYNSHNTMKMDSTDGASYNYFAHSETFSVTAGTLYTAQMLIQTVVTSASAGSAYLEITWFASDGSTVVGRSGSGVYALQLLTSWKAVNVQDFCPAGASKARLRVSHNVGSAGGKRGFYTGAAYLKAADQRTAVTNSSGSDTYGSYNAGITTPGNLVANGTLTAAGSLLVHGAASGTTDSNGEITISHGAPFTPTMVIVTPNGGTSGYCYNVTTISSSQFVIRVQGGATSAGAGFQKVGSGQTVNFLWTAMK